MTMLKEEWVSQREELESYLEIVSGIGIVLLDSVLNIQDCNQGFTRMFQLQRKPFGLPVTNFLILVDDDLKYAEELKLSCNHQTGVQGTVYCRAVKTKKGCLLFCERIILTESRAIEQIGAINNELINLQRESVKKNLLLEKLKRELDERITELEATLARVKQLEEKYRLVVENAAEAIVIAQDGLLKYVNPMAVKILGYSEKVLTSMPFVELLHTEDREKVFEAHSRVMRGEENQSIHEFRVVALDGTIRWADSHAVIIPWDGKPATLNFIIDITERKKAEDARHHYEKLQGVLEMAGAICHEMNQPMQIISGYSEMLLKNISENDPIHTKLDMINKQIIRMGTITKKLMKIKDYETQDYAGFCRIININKSSGEDTE